MNFTAEERETIITTDETMSTWNIYTRSKKVMNKLKKINAIPYDTKLDEEGNIEEAQYALDYSQVSFRKKIILTEEQRQKKRETMLRNLNSMTKSNDD